MDLCYKKIVTLHSFFKIFKNVKKIIKTHMESERSILFEIWKKYRSPVLSPIFMAQLLILAIC